MVRPLAPKCVIIGNNYAHFLGFIAFVSHVHDQFVFVSPDRLINLVGLGEGCSFVFLKNWQSGHSPARVDQLLIEIEKYHLRYPESPESPTVPKLPMLRLIFR